MAARSDENGVAGGDVSEPLLNKEAAGARPYSELYDAGVLSRLTFSWLNPLLRLGRSKSLDLADIPLIASEDGSAPLDAGTIFTVLATLRVMSEPVRMLPEIMTKMIQYRVSLDRIENLLGEEEIRDDDVMRKTTILDDSSDGTRIIHVQDGSFSWSGSELTLKNVHLSIRQGEKVAVCGPVGSGKSSLLCALLGEIPLR